MGDELQENLKTYKLQLQQVEASLTTDSTNEDLLKLKGDLQMILCMPADRTRQPCCAFAAQFCLSEAP